MVITKVGNISYTMLTVKEIEALYNKISSNDNRVILITQPSCIGTIVKVAEPDPFFKEISQNPSYNCWDCNKILKEFPKCAEDITDMEAW